MFNFEAKVRPRRSSAGKPARILRVICPMLLVAIVCSQVLKFTSARYVHPTYKFRTGAELDEDAGQQPSRISRRQDFENDDDDGDDQNAAASYQNQDDGNNGGRNGATDGYDDSEPDGPYEETPVEQEGQADLERFFDDHLGASDRDGMDKENLPSNLVSLLSEPPSSFRMTHEVQPLAGALPASKPKQIQGTSQEVNSLTVVPTASVANPTVLPAPLAAHDPLQTANTIQETSFIRLPDEKMIVTHQVTARTYRPPPPMKPLAQLALSSSSDMGETGEGEPDDHADRGRGSTAAAAAAAAASRVAQGTRRQPLAKQGLARGEARSGAGYKQQQQQHPGGVLPPLGLTISNYDNRLPPGEQDSLAARGSEVVATEDDDDDRVYVTNSTDKPFRIDALGGYDPEEDFIDAAKDLEVMAGPRQRRKSRRPSGSTNRRASSLPPADYRARMHNQRRAPGGHRRKPEESSEATKDEELEFAWAAAAAASNANRQRREPDNKYTGVISFRVPEADHLYGDASETDEVTFGQDDPYQTDLEAEMRQQEFDKLSGWNRMPPAQASLGASTWPGSGPTQSYQPESRSASFNDAVDNGKPPADADVAASGSNSSDQETEDDIDVDVDNEYKSEPKVEQTEARSTRARSRPKETRTKGRHLDDSEDEGGWVNDGVDEMDIPSQSHQNYVLEKAAQRDEAVRKAAEEKEAAEQAKQQPGAESGQTSDDREESQRMPNADYLKNDLIEDDSGYAKAA